MFGIPLALSVKTQLKETCEEGSLLQNSFLQELKTTHCIRQVSVENNTGSAWEYGTHFLRPI